MATIADTIVSGVTAVTESITQVIAGKNELDAQADRDRYTSASQARGMHNDRMSRAYNADKKVNSGGIAIIAFALLIAVIVFSKK